VTEFESEQLLKVLVDESVDFVLVGGYAAILQGQAVRPKTWMSPRRQPLTI
jgi:hypothetical protein